MLWEMEFLENNDSKDGAQNLRQKASTEGSL